MTARARLLTVVAIVFVGALGVISSTQTWLMVTLDDGAHHQLPVAGASAVPVLTPLSLAVLALGGALSIVGMVLRYIFGAVAVAIGGLLAVLSWQVATQHPVSAVASVVTEATGITGIDAVATLVSSISATPWPYITVVLAVVLVAAGAFAITTARGWRGSGRRYETDTAQPSATAPASRPHDAIDSWDDLSRGDDPTA